MESFFDQEDQSLDALFASNIERNPISFFGTRQLLLSSELEAKSGSKKRVKGTFHLYTDCLVSLVQTSDGFERYIVTSLRWKRVMPFIETKEGSKFYGFRLNGCEKCEDFYCASEEQLQTWLENLSSCSIGTDLSNEYSICEQIRDGTFSTVYQLNADGNTAAMLLLKSIPKEKVLTSAMKQKLCDTISQLHSGDTEVTGIQKVFEDHSHIHLVVSGKSPDEVLNLIFQEISL